MRKAFLATIMLSLAGATTFVAACGDDDKDDNATPGDGDVGDGDTTPDGGTPGDGDVGDGDVGDGDVGDGDNTTDGGPGGDGDGDVELDACPTSANITDGGQVCVITGPVGAEITEDLTLAPVKDKLGYLIQDGVFVGEDAGGAAEPAAGKKRVTLTVKPGTTFFGSGALSFLAVNRGSKLVAEGTASKPIVFTSGSENAPAPGDWGGILLLGRAPTNIGNDVTGEVGNVKYGGPDLEDDSGSLKYVRIEFAGGRIDPTHEFNGLTLYGVGSKTKLDYIHVHAGGDDAVEFFGGAASLKHLVSTGGGDDNIDWTDGWVGKVQFVVAQQWPNFGDNGIEADNRDMNNTAEPYSDPTISNITLIGAGETAGNYGLLLRRGTKAQIASALLLNWKTACIKVADATTVGFVGTDLTVDASRLNCTKSFEEDSAVMDSTASSDLFTKGTGNMVLASGDVLTNNEYTQAFDPRPKADSGLLTGGVTPDDAWFEKVDYIGAFGEENWMEGGWVKITPYTPPAM